MDVFPFREQSKLFHELPGIFQIPVVSSPQACPSYLEICMEEYFLYGYFLTCYTNLIKHPRKKAIGQKQEQKHNDSVAKAVPHMDWSTCKKSIHYCQKIPRCQMDNVFQHS